MSDQERRVHLESHSVEEIARRLNTPSRHNYLRDFIYGSVDGSVTTFAIVAGVAGAGLSSGVVIVLGLANLIADAFSMAAGNFLGIRAEQDVQQAIVEEERRHIEIYPEGEREEIRQIFANLGFSGEELEHIVSVITADKERWVATMLRYEFGMSLSGPNPYLAAVITFFSFIVVGAIPLLVYLFDLFAPGYINQAFFWSCLLTGISFFLIGSYKSSFTTSSWFRSGTETLIVGSVAAFVAYFIGAMLQGLA